MYLHILSLFQNTKGKKIFKHDQELCRFHNSGSHWHDELFMRMKVKSFNYTTLIPILKQMNKYGQHRWIYKIFQWNQDEGQSVINILVQWRTIFVFIFMMIKIK